MTAIKRIRDRVGWLLFSAAIVWLLAGGPLRGQSTLSTIRGIVMDQTNSVIPGVQLTITEVKTNVNVRTALSDDYGNYEVPDLHPGTYRITAELPGFKTSVADQITLGGSQIRRVDVVLHVGEITDHVRVEAGTAVIATDSAEISTGFTEKLFEASPMVRTYYPQALMTTLPGTDSQMGGYSLKIAGQPTSQIAEGMDGVWTNDGTVNLINNMIDFTELKVVAVNNTADQARVANFNMVSKRGSNAFHGTAFYTHFNSALNAREFFQPQKPPLIEHRGHVDVSGPIIKDRTFFYASYFYQRLPTGSFNRASVPTLKMRRGDFSQFSRPVMDPLTGRSFPGNIVPAERLNPTSSRVQEQFIPPPNLGGPDTLVNNLGFSHPYPDDLFRADYLTVRIDHNITEKNTMFGRFTQRFTPYVLKQGLPGFDWTRIRWHRGTVISDTHAVSSTLVNTFRFGWMWDFVEDGRQVNGFKPRRGDEVVEQIGLQGVNPRNFKAMGFPRMDITGLTSLETVAGGVKQNDHSFIFSESLTWSSGCHVWKFGEDLKRVSRFDGAISEGTYGRFGFNGRFTGHAYADFLLGLPHMSQRLDPLTNRTQRAYEFGIYVMDSFKLTRRLTIDYGLRWDYFSAPSYKDGLQYNWDPTTGHVIVSEAAHRSVSPLYPRNITVVTGKVPPDSKWTNFRPRLGFAYRLRDHTVLRGGYGVFTEQVGYFDRLQGGGPFEISETYFNEIRDEAPFFAFPNPFPTSLASAVIASQSIRGYPTKTSNGVIHQFNISIEQQIRDIGFRISYIGSRSRGLNYTLNINKPRPSPIPFSPERRLYPQFVNASFVQENGASNYNALQIEVQRKVGALVFDAHYTLQSSMSNFLNLQNPYDPNQWNRESLAREKLVVATTIDLPFGRGRRYLSNGSAAVDKILGGWQVVTISFFKSGPFFSASFSSADPSNTNTFGGLPDRVGDGNLPPGQRKVEKWFDRMAFVVPPAGRLGNSAVNVLEGPGVKLHHLSLVKQFKASERFALEYIVGISNLFNTPHFQFPRNDISAPRPGEITAARRADQDNEKAGPRMIEMSLRLRW